MNASEARIKSQENRDKALKNKKIHTANLMAAIHRECDSEIASAVHYGKVTAWFSFPRDPELLIDEVRLALTSRLLGEGYVVEGKGKEGIQISWGAA